MRKRLIAIAICAAIAAPLTAQAAVATGDGWKDVRTVQVTTQAKQKATPAVMQATKLPGEPSYALIGPGSGGLFESDPATLIAASGSCGGACHSIKGDVPSGVSGGDSMAGSTTS